MSHLVTIKTEIRDSAAVSAACRRLALAEPVHGTARLFASEATGLIINLSGWQYPCVIDTSSGNIAFDNYGGAWGATAELDKFIQMYAVERAKAEARKHNLQVSEQALTDGSIKVLITET